MACQRLVSVELGQCRQRTVVEVQGRAAAEVVPTHHLALGARDVTRLRHFRENPLNVQRHRVSRVTRVSAALPCRLRLSHTHTPSWLATTRPGHTPGAQLTAPDKDVSSSMHGSFAASPLPVVSEPGRLLPIERALFYRPGSVWTTLAAQESDLEEPCRFCFDTAPACELIAPCACVGTQRLVHISCLQQWQRVASLSGSGHKARHCDVCLQPFSSSLPALRPEERAQLVIHRLGRWTMSCWLYATAACTALGMIVGAQVGTALIARGTYHVLIYVDKQAAKSATFALTTLFALPLTLPAAGAAAYTILLSCVTAGGTFGLHLGVFGGPALAVGGILRLGAAGLDLSARVVAHRRRR